MTHTVRLPALSGAMLLCLAALASTASNEAAAQGIRAPRDAQSYYNGYSAGYNSGYQNGYTGYGYGPYGYGSSSQFEPRTSTGYGYQNGTYNSLYYRALRLRGGTYSPNTVRVYNPYGNGSY